MSNRQQLLDLHVYGKGMQTHIVAKSEMIGNFVKDNAYKNYGDVAWVTVPRSVATFFGEDKTGRLCLLDKMDERIGNHYGYGPYHGRGYGIVDPDVSGYNQKANVALFLMDGIAEGLHLVLPRYVGGARINAYVKEMREEAEWFFKTFLRPAQRRVKIFVEDIRYE